MKELSDAELMARTGEGDRSAFGVLIDRHKDPVVNYLTKLTGNRSNAEDAAQETFVKLFHAAPRYREQGQFSAFLYRIATNLVRQEHRRRRRWQIVSGALTRRVRVTAEDPEAANHDLLRREMGRELVMALACLPLRYRVPLVLRDVQGWAYGDIARLTGSRLGTVKSRISRGRTILRQSLEPYRTRGETLAQRTTA